MIGVGGSLKGFDFCQNSPGMAHLLRKKSTSLPFIRISTISESSNRFHSPRLCLLYFRHWSGNHRWCCQLPRFESRFDWGKLSLSRNYSQQSSWSTQISSDSISLPVRLQSRKPEYQFLLDLETSHALVSCGRPRHLQPSRTFCSKEYSKFLSHHFSPPPASLMNLSRQWWLWDFQGLQREFYGSIFHGWEKIF